VVTAGQRARYDKLAVRYEATVCIAAINEWPLPHFDLDQASGEVFQQQAGQTIW